ncbi:VIT1/CCC1 transporter family protein [Candidatus Gottesmanbacteria bacterium]|nr:VIT1/CCC1 transporter family protein [Candidatus Gottesmanbacteria bacterium]
MENRTRIDIAREAFLKRDKELSKEAHGRDIIKASINHREGHITSFSLPEIILGGQDGLVNVLGVILGVAAASADVRIVIVAGLAATFAESVSMAAVAYTSKLARADFYQSEYEREKWEIENEPEGEIEEIRSLYRKYGFEGKQLDDIVEKITSNKKVWLEVMMADELKLEPVDRNRALKDGVIVGVSAVVGSFVPLTPFFFLPIQSASIVAVGFSALILFIVGYYKAKVTFGRNFLRQGMEIMIIGMVSAFVGYFIGSLFKL